MTDVLASLIEDFRRHRLILFAGSGVSAALDLPTWSGLIEQMATRLDYEPDVFLSLGDFPALADYYRRTDPDLSGLIDWMDREWHAPTIEVSRSRLHRAIALARFPVIYTTNYDWWLEKAHDVHGISYRAVVTGADIAGLDGDSTEIVKFHGDLATRYGLVITETDYFERLRIDTELDIKLRYDMLRYSLLFVGYSLQDVNIRAMLHRLSLFRAIAAAPDVRSYVVMGSRNEVQATLARKWNLAPLYVRDLDLGNGVADFMEELAAGALTAVEVAPEDSPQGG
jgi:hypothetical protein